MAQLVKHQALDKGKEVVGIFDFKKLVIPVGIM